MGLKKCEDCNNEISEKAEVCPFCGSLKKKPRQVRTAKSSKSSSNPNRSKIALPLFGLFSLVLVTVVLKWPQQQKPLPVILKSYKEDTQNNMLEYGIALHSTIQNNGVSGRVVVNFSVYQNKREYVRTDTLNMNSNEIREVEKVFDEVTLIDGPVRYKIDLLAK
jgi:hypothetical protein